MTTLAYLSFEPYIDHQNRSANTAYYRHASQKLWEKCSNKIQFPEPWMDVMPLIRLKNSTMFKDSI